METVADFILLVSKINADGDCRHEIKTTTTTTTTIAPWKKSYDKSRQYNKKQRHTLPTIVHVVKAVVFPVVMYGCESWTIKKPEHQRLDTFEL